MGLPSAFLFAIIPIARTGYRAEMEAPMNREENRIQKLLGEMAELGPIMPGSISEQWNKCGKKGCRCKDPEKPVKHGP